jgi:hypothetical protein
MVERGEADSTCAGSEGIGNQMRHTETCAGLDRFFRQGQAVPRFLEAGLRGRCVPGWPDLACIMAGRRAAATGLQAFIVPLGLACSLCLAAARADETAVSTQPPEAAPELRWMLTRTELEAFVASYQARHAPAPESFLEEVAVKAPPVPLRMRDLSQDVWGGVAAPFWALLHPTQSWRILLPIPPKRAAPEDSDREGGK